MTQDSGLIEKYQNLAADVDTSLPNLYNTVRFYPSG